MLQAPLLEANHLPQLSFFICKTNVLAHQPKLEADQKSQFSFLICNINVIYPGVTHDKQNYKHVSEENDMNSVCLW